MTPTLTHTDCCRIVEDALERVAKTLAYIRLRLDTPQSADKKQLTLFEKNTVEEANLLCNVNYYGSYLQGVCACYRALKDGGYLDIPKEANGIMTAKETRIMNKAHLDCFMENTRNLEWFLHGCPKDIDLMTKFERDKKGKIIGAKSKFLQKRNNEERDMSDRIKLEDMTLGQIKRAKNELRESLEKAIESVIADYGKKYDVGDIEIIVNRDIDIVAPYFSENLGNGRHTISNTKVAYGINITFSKEDE